MCSIDIVPCERAARAQREAFQQMRADMVASTERRRRAQAKMRAIMDGEIWRAANPVLSRGWDDWSLLVRDEGWR